MTRMIESLAARPAPQRIAIAVILSIVGLFCAGLVIGVIAGMVSLGHLPKRLWVLAIPFVAAPLAVMSLKTAWQLAVPPKSATGYEKRYWRMWMLVTLLGMPVGAALAIGTSSGKLELNPFSSTPISPAVAVLLAALVTGFFALALILYHRAIDDHEERAYLWGSQLAYYFLILAFPAWWLLQRGALVGPITATGALGAILISFVVQGGVWAWLKFR